MKNLLFVYGTLRRSLSGKDHPFLRGNAHYVAGGKARGALLKQTEYPALIRSPFKEAWVTGKIYRLEDPALLLPFLDAYEGEDYSRVPDTVLMHDRPLEAWVYLYRPLEIE